MISLLIQMYWQHFSNCFCIEYLLSLYFLLIEHLLCFGWLLYKSEVSQPELWPMQWEKHVNKYSAGTICPYALLPSLSYLTFRTWALVIIFHIDLTSVLQNGGADRGNGSRSPHMKLLTNPGLSHVNLYYVREKWCLSYLSNFNIFYWIWIMR